MNQIDNKVKIVIVDDHRMIRKAWRGIFSSETDYEIVADFENGKGVIEYLRHNVVDVVLMDITMPEMDGIEATKIIKSSLNPPKIIALSMHKEHVYIKEMLDAGADGYVDKDSSPLELFIAIDEVIDDMKYLSSKIRLEHQLIPLNNYKVILN